MLLLHAAALMPFPARARAAQVEERAAKVKAGVARRGVGEKAAVRVGLQNGGKLKGYICQAGEDSFTLTGKSGETRTLAYRDAAEVKGRGGLSPGAEPGVGAGVAVGAPALIYAAGCHDTSACRAASARTDGKRAAR